MVVSDNEIELTSDAIPKWWEDSKVDWHCIALGKPMGNGFVECVNGRMCDACLSRHLFDSFYHALDLIAAWGTDHNHERLQPRLVGLTPEDCADRLKEDQNLNRANPNYSGPNGERVSHNNIWYSKILNIDLEGFHRRESR